MFTYDQGDIVIFRNMGCRGRGKVVGVVTREMYGLGDIYMVEVEDPEKSGINRKTYPYSTIGIAEIHLCPC